MKSRVSLRYFVSHSRLKTMEQELTFFQGYKQLIFWFALAARLNLLKSPDILGEER